MSQSVSSRGAIAYGSAKDEVLDLYYQEGTNAPRPTIVWVHGGGFVAGSKNGIANYMKILAGHRYTMFWRKQQVDPPDRCLIFSPTSANFHEPLLCRFSTRMPWALGTPTALSFADNVCFVKFFDGQEVRRASFP